MKDAGNNSKYSVTFSPDEQQKYGFDQPGVNTSDGVYNSETVAGESQKISWKSIASGDVEKLDASITGSPADSVQFSRESASMVMVSPADKDNKRKLMIVGGSDQTTDALNAYYYQASNDSSKEREPYLAGRLNLVSYDRITVNVYLVAVNGSQLPDKVKVQQALNNIYAPAVVQWSVSTLKDGLIVALPGDNQKEIDNTDNDDRIDYTPDMKLVNQAMEENPAYQDNTCYLFFFDNAADNDVKGYLNTPLFRQLYFKDKLDSSIRPIRRIEESEQPGGTVPQAFYSLMTDGFSEYYKTSYTL